MLRTCRGYSKILGTQRHKRPHVNRTVAVEDIRVKNDRQRDMLWGKWNIDTPKSVVRAEFKMETLGLGATGNSRSSLMATTNQTTDRCPLSVLL